MMQAMRERVKVIYWVVIVSFVGLMFLVWGVGDSTQKKSPQRGSGVVARVNGQDVSATVWRERTNAIRDQMRARQADGQTLTQNQIMRAQDQAFDELVTETLMRDGATQAERQVTDEEIADILKNTPPPSLLAQFVDENGTPDYNAYYRALQSQNFPWQQIVRSMRSTIPLQKMQQRISSQALVSEPELRQAFVEQNQRIVAEYVGVSLDEIEIDEGDPADSELKAWYDAHPGDYRQPERATVRLATIAKTASDADAQEILSILTEIREDIVAGRQSFEEAARVYSEDTSSDSGGDLGFFDRNRMVEPFTESAFALAVSEVSQPVKTQFGYHLIECIDEKLDDSGERSEMRARHILLKLRASQTTMDDLREAADDLHQGAANSGLEAAAAAASTELTVSAAFQEGFNLPGVPNSLPGSRFAFDHEAGALSPVYETEELFYIFEVAERIDAGLRPLEEVRAQVVGAVQNDARVKEAVTKLADALGGQGGDADLASIATASGLSHAITDTFTLRQSIPEIGFATPFARAALAIEPGQLLREVHTDTGIYALRVLYKSDFDEDAFRSSRDALARNLAFSRSRIVLQQWLESRREEAEIEDLRDQLL
jgi:peptidyl-prolyl cis-trans isomerase D